MFSLLAENILKYMLVCFKIYKDARITHGIVGPVPVILAKVEIKIKIIIA